MINFEEEISRFRPAPELDDAEISYNIMRSEPFHLSGVRYDGLDGIKI